MLIGHMTFSRAMACAGDQARETLRYDADLHGRARTYLNVFPAKNATKRVREKIRAKTRSNYKYPLIEVIKQVNQITSGWKNYFDYGYPRKDSRDLNHF